MTKIRRYAFFSGIMMGLVLGFGASLILGALREHKITAVEAAEKAPKGMFVNLINFPPVKPGKEPEFLEWFRWSNDVYAKHKGFISRTLLKPIDGGATYAAIVEHESKETFMAMHMSQNREEAYNRVAPLLQGKPTPHFFEVVVSYKK